MTPETRPTLMFALGLAPQKVGGIERLLRSLVILLDEAGWDTVLCFDGPASVEFLEYMDGLSVSMETLTGQKNLGVSAAAQLLSLMRKYRPRVFVYAFHGVMRCFPWIAKICGCRRVIFNDHSSRAPGFVPRPLGYLKRLVGQFLTIPIDAVVSVSHFTERTREALGIANVRGFVVPNGVEVRPPSRERRSSFRERFGVPQEAIVVIQVSSMIPEKGVVTTLRAAKRILHSRPDVHFILVGEGPQKEEYMQLALDLGIDEQVIFTGKITNPVEEGVFDGADIYCQPSVWQEACPLAILEAMSANLPVVASHVGGIPELVENGKNGYLIGVDSVEQMAECLSMLIDNPSMRRNLGNAGYAVVEDRHRIKITAEAYHRIFLNCELSLTRPEAL